MSARGIARLVAGIGVVAGATVACGDPVVCADEGGDIHPPADTTVALHQSIVLEAGSGGRCNGGPLSIDEQTHWQVGDSTIVSLVVLDLGHVRINGLSVGTTSVTASSLHLLATTTLVTVR